MNERFANKCFGWCVAVAIVGSLGFGYRYSTNLALPSRIDEEAVDEEAVEEESVRRACLDYVEGVYEVKPELIERGVHADLVKYGYWRPNAETDFQGSAMTYDQLYELAGTYNKDGRIGSDAPKEITVFDVLDKTASAKLVADWGIDYFHLVKVEGKDGAEDQWKILQVMWQSPPAE